GKWLFWGHVYIQSQTVSKKFNADGSWTVGSWVTSGSFKIIEVYDPEYQKAFTIKESAPGRSFF
ncbi:hypothetical protein ABTE58_19035, partial [Acinetobacter baumannii]